ncbi:MAG: transglutaminase family protein [Oligoflexia bacterium]|nr:transglutaminase family protein [Oligoflexia bacterium]
MSQGLSEKLSFGFEQTFTIPDWWTDPGFVSTSDTPRKRECMLALAEATSRALGGGFVESTDIYGHLQYETRDSRGEPSFVVTMDPGSIEVKTRPMLRAGLVEALAPLFEAARSTGAVPYREWWYGVRTGTEGGCHVNMGGLRPESNPLIADPALVLKYACFFHNHPCIHYPFMGIDVGPGGNCMRMDEFRGAADEVGSRDSLERIRRFCGPQAEAIPEDAASFARVFEGSTLAEDKHSAPSFYKYRAPDFLLEDRAVEALRSPEEFGLVTDLRLRILEALQREQRPREPREFGTALHREQLFSENLWEAFCRMATEIGLPSVPYRVFFDRQFPVLRGGEAVPSLLELREGRRPRVIKDVQMRGKLVISKTIDTSYKRFELLWPSRDESGRTLVCSVNGQRLRPRITAAGRSAFLLDLRKGSEDSVLRLTLSARDGETVESAVFSIHDMMYRRESPEAFAEPRSKESPEFYMDLGLV